MSTVDWVWTGLICFLFVLVGAMLWLQRAEKRERRKMITDLDKLIEDLKAAKEEEDRQ